jgi:hypothetical protein
MKKLIDFKTLKEVCIWESRNGLKCSYPTGQNAEKCCDDNCPVWKKLKEPESFTRTIKITKPYDVCEHTDNSPPSNESEKQNNPYEEEKLIKDALPSETYAHYGRFGSIKRGRKL